MQVLLWTLLWTGVAGLCLFEISFWLLLAVRAKTIQPRSGHDARLVAAEVLPLSIVIPTAGPDWISERSIGSAVKVASHSQDDGPVKIYLLCDHPPPDGESEDNVAACQECSSWVESGVDVVGGSRGSEGKAVRLNGLLVDHGLTLTRRSDCSPIQVWMIVDADEALDPDAVRRLRQAHASNPTTPLQAPKLDEPSGSPMSRAFAAHYNDWFAFGAAHTPRRSCTYYGSCAMIPVYASDDGTTDGFNTESEVEDFPTFVESFATDRGVKLWDESVARGLAPVDLVGVLRLWERWSAGNLRYSVRYLRLAFKSDANTSIAGAIHHTVNWFGGIFLAQSVLALLALSIAGGPSRTPAAALVLTTLVSRFFRTVVIGSWPSLADRAMRFLLEPVFGIGTLRAILLLAAGRPASSITPRETASIGRVYPTCCMIALSVLAITAAAGNLEWADLLIMGLTFIALGALAADYLIARSKRMDVPTGRGSVGDGDA